MSEHAQSKEPLIIDIQDRASEVFNTVVEVGEIVPGGKFATPEMVAHAFDGMKVVSRRAAFAMVAGRLPYDYAVTSSTIESTSRDKFGRKVTTYSTTDEWHPIWIIRDEEDYSGRQLAKNKRTCLAIDTNGNPLYLQSNGRYYEMLGYQSHATPDKFFDTYNTRQPELGLIQEQWSQDLAAASKRYNARKRTGEFNTQPVKTFQERTEVSDTLKRRLRILNNAGAAGTFLVAAAAILMHEAADENTTHKADNAVVQSVVSHESLEDQCYSSPDIVPAGKATKNEDTFTVTVTEDTPEIKAMGALERVIVEPGVHVGMVLACGGGVEVQVEGSVDQAVLFGALPVLKVTGKVGSAELYGARPEATVDTDGHLGQLVFNKESVNPPTAGHTVSDS